MKLAKNDKVIVISGDDKGKTGVVTSVDPKASTILVEGVGVYKKHLKQSANQEGGIVNKLRPIFTSKVKLVCGSCGKPTKVRFTGTGKEKVRICSICQKPVAVKSPATK